MKLCTTRTSWHHNAFLLLVFWAAVGLFDFLLLFLTLIKLFINLCNTQESLFGHWGLLGLRMIPIVMIPARPTDAQVDDVTILLIVYF